MNVFALTPRVLDGELWRLWTCHATHWDSGHALLNAAAALPPLVFMAWKASLRRLLVWALVAAPLLSVVLLATGFYGEYRGASGIVAGAWAFGAVALARAGEGRSAVLLGAFLLIKIAFELAGVRPSSSGSFTTIPLVHYVGVALGAVGAAWIGGNHVSHIAARELRHRDADGIRRRTTFRQASQLDSASHSG